MVIGLIGAGLKKVMKHASVLILIFLGGLMKAQSPQMPKYSVDDGKIVILFQKEIIRFISDSVLNVYGIEEPEAIKAFRNNDWSTFTENGWVVKDRGKKGIEISRPLEPLMDFVIDDSKMFLSSVFMAEDKPGIPIIKGKIGFNRLKGEYPKQLSDSLCLFKIIGQTTAEQVYLSGSFNSWATTELPMIRKDDGWEVKVSLKPGKHLYKYVVDGKWFNDKTNELQEGDGYGGMNSIFFVTNHTFKFISEKPFKRVYLSGSFNDWRPKDLLMSKLSNFHFELPVYLVNGTYSYKFVADGDWFSDKQNPNKVYDGNDGFNSVISIGKPFTFKLKGYENAKKVFLAGDFNGWNPDELALTYKGGLWQLDYVLAPGNYQYKFIVDNEWTLDPGNQLSVDDGAGNKNSFVVIESNYTFTYNGNSSTKEVVLTGSFNSWNESAFKMRRMGNTWTFKLHLGPGKYLYKFIVDGNWLTDPNNKLWEENEYGGSNSVLWVEN